MHKFKSTIFLVSAKKAKKIINSNKKYLLLVFKRKLVFQILYFFYFIFDGDWFQDSSHNIYIN